MIDPAWLFWSLIFGAFGLGYFLYGKKQADIVCLIVGVALMVYPYFVANAWWLVAIGGVLTATPWLIAKL